MTPGFDYVFWFQEIPDSKRVLDGVPYWKFPLDGLNWEFDLALKTPNYGLQLFSMYRLDFKLERVGGVKTHNGLRYSVNREYGHWTFHDLSHGFWFYVYDSRKSLEFRELNSRACMDILDLELSVKGISAAKSGSGSFSEP